MREERHRRRFPFCTDLSLLRLLIGFIKNSAIMGVCGRSKLTWIFFSEKGQKPGKRHCSLTTYLVIRSKHKSHFSPKTLRENVLKQNCRSERIGVPHKGQLGVFFDLPLKSFVETANHRCGYNLEGNEPVVDGASTTDT